MAIRIDGHLDAGVAELIFHVGWAFAVHQKQRCECVPQVMEPNATQTRMGEALLKMPSAEIVVVERFPFGIDEHPVGHFFALLEVFLYPAPL